MSIVRRHRRRSLLAVASLALLAPLGACATALGGREPLVTDRPDFTESVDVVQPSHAQVEGGATTSREGVTREHALGEVLVRVGVTRRAELRLAPNSSVVQRVGGRTVATGMEDASIGTKVRLYGGRGMAPATSLIVGTTLPTGGSAFRGRSLSPEAKLLLAWDLSEKLSLSSNLNVESAREGGGRVTTYASSASFGLALTERIGSYAEYFGFYPQGSAASHYANGGLTYLLSPDLQLDGRAGQGMNGIDGDWFVGFGISRRF